MEKQTKINKKGYEDQGKRVREGDIQISSHEILIFHFSFYKIALFAFLGNYITIINRRFQTQIWCVASSTYAASTEPKHFSTEAYTQWHHIHKISALYHLQLISKNLEKSKHYAYGIQTGMYQG